MLAVGRPLRFVRSRMHCMCGGHGICMCASVCVNVRALRLCCATTMCRKFVRMFGSYMYICYDQVEATTHWSLVHCVVLGIWLAVVGADSIGRYECVQSGWRLPSIWQRLCREALREQGLVTYSYTVYRPYGCSLFVNARMNMDAVPCHANSIE